MMPEVRVSEFAASKIAAEYGPERSTAGKPSEWDFWSGPLAAALLGSGTSRISFGTHVQRFGHSLVAPVVGALVFIDVLIERPAALTGLPQKR